MQNANQHNDSDYAALWYELCAYVGFGPEHADALARMRPALEPKFPTIVDAFYTAIENNPRAKSVFSGGSAQMERQKALLSQWLHELFSGVYDDEYVERHARIGRTHVRIGLGQRYMVSAMALVRDGLRGTFTALDDPPVDAALGQQAITLVCDLELAVMLETYSDHYIDQIRTKERLATLGQIAGFVGHELRNPLSVMETSLHLLRHRVTSTEERAVHHLDRLTEQVRLSNKIIAGLLELARDRQPERERVDLPQMLHVTVDGIPGHERLRLEPDIHEDASYPRVDPTHLRHLLVNLISNAATALREHGRDGRIWVRAHADETALVLTVDDEGPGLDEHMLKQLFEPLHTTRTQGLGLGLSLCQKIAQKHRGFIKAENRPQGGARFIVRLEGAFDERGDDRS